MQGCKEISTRTSMKLSNQSVTDYVNTTSNYKSRSIVIRKALSSTKNTVFHVHCLNLMKKLLSVIQTTLILITLLFRKKQLRESQAHSNFSLTLKMINSQTNSYKVQKARNKIFDCSSLLR